MFALIEGTIFQSRKGTKMASSKSKHSNIERELARELTWACELAKHEITGFEWLTHRVDHTRFPDTLIVTWIFDNERNMQAAAAGSGNARMQALTLAAFEAIGIVVDDIAKHLRFDCEERCASTHGGNWAARLAPRAGKAVRR